MEKYVHIVRFYEGHYKTNSLNYDFSKCRLVGILKIESEFITTFWKNIVNAGGNYFLQGSFYDFYNSTENKNWGDGKDISCIKYTSKNFMFIKTVMLPKKSTFTLEPWAKRKCIETRKSITAKRLFANICHYDLRLKNRTCKFDSIDKIIVNIPKELAEKRFDEMVRTIQFIPTAVMKINPFYGSIFVEMDLKIAMRFCGFYH